MSQEPMNGRAQSVWEQRWRERIAAWRQSGLSQQAFCRAEGLSVSSFSHWKSELAKRDRSSPSPEDDPAERAAAAGSPEALRWKEVRWPELAPEVPMAREISGFEIVLPRGWSVRLGAGFEAESLRRLLSVLEERSC